MPSVDAAALTSAPLPTVEVPRKRIASIQVCRGLAALMVVLAHLHTVESKYFLTDWLSGFQFGVVGVDVFFVISGLVISVVTWGKFGSVRSAGQFLYHRLARVYPVFWVYTLIVLAAFLYNPNWINAREGHKVHIVRSFFLIPSDRAMLVMQGWTLSFEIYFYVVFAVLLLLPGRFLPWLLLLWGAVVTLLSISSWPHGPVLGTVTSPLMLEFVAGCVLYRVYRYNRLSPMVGVVSLAAAALWLAAIALWTSRFHQFDETWIELSRWGRPALYGVFAVLFVLGLLELERTRLLAYWKPLEGLGDWSYSIYLSHIIVIEFVGRAVSRFMPGEKLGMAVVLLIALPAVLLVGYLSARWLEQPLMRYFYGLWAKESRA